MSQELENATSKRDKKWKDLEKTITALVKEQYRLMGMTVYEPLNSALETEVKGKG